MRRLSFLSIVGAVILLMVNPLHALEESPQTETRFGIGITLSRNLAFTGEEGEASFLPAGLTNFYFPILMNPNFRLEPEFGFWRYSYSRKNDFEYSDSHTSIRPGIGFFSMTQRDKVILYYGLRLGFIFNFLSDESNGDKDDDSRTDFSIGPALGGEYFFSDHLSLGGEAQLNYIFVGQWDYDDDIDRSESLIANRALFFVRWYY
jgi:hypothetical protein